ncbi:MAG: CehA/McbA family metallohydrolase [Oscillospiraceae bacterium]|jgi:hypothetical protein|nr:CehA/McbA family metallohydrolase [Oscillospiraceae bacterium]
MGDGGGDTRECAPLRRLSETCVQAELDVRENTAGFCAGWLPEHAPAFSLAVLFDPYGALRYNKWLRGGEVLTLGRDARHTGLGGVPGAIAPGKWTLRLFTPAEATAAGGEAAPAQPLAEVRFGEAVPDEPIGDGVCALFDGADIMTDNPPAAVSSGSAARPRAGWYKGDFHAHTHLSDGKESVASAAQKARRMGLDFYTPTEHNTAHTAWPDAPPLALPGIEITSERGHFNIIGLTRLPADFFTPENMDGGFVRPERMNSILAYSAGTGAVNSLNHPFLREWKWDIPDTPLALFHTVEIICDPTYTFSREGNERALELWTRLWNDGNTIYGVGGSDSHNLEHERYDGADGPSIPGDPASWVYCESLTRGELIRGVKAGHVWVCRGGTKLYPEFWSGGRAFLPGDRLEAGSGDVLLRCSLRADGAPEGAYAQWIVNGEIHAEAPLRGSGASFSASADAARYTWARVDIRDASGALYGFVNPVWWGERTGVYRTFAAVTL